MLYARLYAGPAMNSFILNLFDASHEQRIDGVTSFIGEDASGCFGIQAQHARFMTTLVFGLSRFRLSTDEWRYLALPGAVAYFDNNELTISTLHFLIDTDFNRISQLLEQHTLVEEETVHASKESFHLMEQAMLKRILALNRKPGWQS
jgi:F-type H+-transporting ATPase subunit epsilon